MFALYLFERSMQNDFEKDYCYGTGPFIVFHYNAHVACMTIHCFHHTAHVACMSHTHVVCRLPYDVCMLMYIRCWVVTCFYISV